MTERIRVLRVIGRLNVGGPAQQISALARGMDPERFDHRILCGSVEEGEADWLALRGQGVEVVRVDALGRSIGLLREVRALWGVIAEIRRFRPHVVHTHAAKAGVIGRIAAWACRVPVTVHTFHGHLLHGYFSRAGTAAVRTVERILARRTTWLAAVGAQVRDDLLAAGIGRPAQYRVVPPGVWLPPAPDRAIAREALGLPASAPVVAFVARLTGVKRPDRMLETVRLALRELPDLVVLVVGEGPELHGVRARAADLGEHVRWLGWRPDVEAVYAAADVALLTSDNEGMPVSLIEAAMCGVPAVATAVGSVAEVVLDGATGYVVRPEAGELADALVRLLRDAARRAAMGDAAHVYAVDRFSTSRLVRDYEVLYGR